MELVHQTYFLVNVSLFMRLGALQIGIHFLTGFRALVRTLSMATDFGRKMYSTNEQLHLNYIVRYSHRRQQP
jgi:hypothetical protein